MQVTLPARARGSEEPVGGFPLLDGVLRPCVRVAADSTKDFICAAALEGASRWRIAVSRTSQIEIGFGVPKQPAITRPMCEMRPSRAEALALQRRCPGERPMTRGSESAPSL
jgi:hypothetical protein